MATIYPSMEEILCDQMEKHTEGEQELLQILQNLPDEYRVYFQPHLNFAHPDIIILHPQGGALIIEVKDWNLSSYKYVIETSSKPKYEYLQVKNEGTHLKTPFEQACDYKDELFRMLYPEISKEKTRLGERCRNVYGVIKTAVYFHKAKNEDVICLFGNRNIEKNNNIKNIKSIRPIGVGRINNSFAHRFLN